MAFQEPLCALPWHVDVRFGRWNELLTRPLPANVSRDVVTVATALWARALAFSALGRLAEAEAEAERFEAAVLSRMMPSARDPYPNPNPPSPHHPASPLPSPFAPTLHPHPHPTQVTLRCVASAPTDGSTT